MALASLSPGRSQADELAEAMRRAAELTQAGKFQDALPEAERALELAKSRFGEGHVDSAKAMVSLARIYQRLSRLDEAAPLYKRALAIQVAQLGEAHRDTSETRNLLALFHRGRGQYPEAEALLRQALSIYDEGRGADFRDAVFSLDILTGLLRLQGRFKDAEPVLKRALAIREKELGLDSPETAKNRGNLALLFRDMGRYSETEPLLKSALAAYERSVGGEHINVVETLDVLIGLYRLQGRFNEAEPHLVRALAIRQKIRPDDPDTARSLGNLALLYRDQRRYAETEELLQRALAIRVKALGPEHPDLIESLDILAGLYRLWKRSAEAEPHLARALAIREKRLGAEHPDTAKSIGNLAMVYMDLGRHQAAAELMERSTSVRERALGKTHPAVAESLDMLAGLYRASGRSADAEALLLRALQLRQDALGADHPTTAESLHNLADLYFQREDWLKAVDYYEKSNNVILTRRTADVLSPTATAQRHTASEVARYSDRFINYVRSAHRLASAAPARQTELRAKAYEMAQWALLTDTSSALAQMAARFGSGSDALARLVREHQDLGNEWRTRDERLVANLSRPSAQRNAGEERTLRARLEAIEARLGTIGRDLQQKFPDYVALSSPKPLTLAQTQSALRPDEALLQAAFAKDEGYAWLVTKTDVRWHAIPMGKTALGDRIAALRCGLDSSNWETTRDWPEETAADKLRIREQTARRERCRQLLNIEVSSNQLPPFDLDRAHELYRMLLAPFADLMQGKSLIVVPTGPLGALPLHVLVTRPPDPSLQGQARYQQAKWLALEKPISVLPSVGSLQALRKLPRSKATQPYIAFGNPLLDGRPGSEGRAREAVDKQLCQQNIAARRQRIAQAGASPSRRVRGVLVDLDELRAQEPLPETADELCAVARALGAVAREKETVWLGQRATEANLKALNASHALARYSVIHFATHGLLSGESEMLLKVKGEPALMLTPPSGRLSEIELEHDNGLLSASEVAQLDLDADWIVLSACNTAGGESDDAEALSGLARAFFYAKARALLVSHWYVSSDAAVKLTVKAFAELKANPNRGRAQALLRSMTELITKGTADDAHPATWAPFVVVGEGRR